MTAVLTCICHKLQPPCFPLILHLLLSDVEADTLQLHSEDSQSFKTRNSKFQNSFTNWFMRKFSMYMHKESSPHLRYADTLTTLWKSKILTASWGHFDCVTPASDIVSRQRLRYASRHQLLVPRYQLSSLGRRSFAVAGPTTLNSLSLSADLRDPTCSDESFRRSLKTFLFAKY